MSNVPTPNGSVNRDPGEFTSPSPAVGEGHSSVEDGSGSRGQSAPPEVETARTPQREAGSSPPTGDRLDSYRVTDRNSDSGGDSPSETFPETGDDCPYPIEIGVDEWDSETGELVGAGIELLPCGRKGCPVCGPRLRDRYTAHFARTFGELAQDRPIWFLTLTVDPKVFPEDADETDARKYLKHCWEKYRKRLRRRAEDLKYAGAFELHSDGDRWHLHVVVAADFPGRETEGEIREMMRVQWFESGGGAVGKVKRIREDRTKPSADGTPDGISGAVGYVVKYAFKDAAEAHSAAESRRSVLASEGVGYYSEAAKERRREFAEGQSTSPERPVVKEYRSLVDGGAPDVERDPDPARSDTLTDEDRERFERWDRSVRTLTYRERVEDAPQWGGRTVWIVWKMDSDAGRLRRTVFDGWPDRPDSSVLEAPDEPPVNGSSTENGPKLPPGDGAPSIGGRETPACPTDSARETVGEAERETRADASTEQTRDMNSATRERSAPAVADRSPVPDPKEVEESVRGMMDGPGGSTALERANEALSYLRSVEKEIRTASVFETGAEHKRKALRRMCRELRREVEETRTRAELACEIDVEASGPLALLEIVEDLRADVSRLETEVRETREAVVEAASDGENQDARVRRLETRKRRLERKRLKLEVAREKVESPAPEVRELLREAGTENQIRSLYAARMVLRENEGITAAREFDEACESGGESIRKAVRRLGESLLGVPPSNVERYDGRSRGAVPALRSLVSDLWEW